jgi:hypothetical protein
METPFFGGTYQSFSPNVADNRCMNLIPELLETKEGKQAGVFYATPGQKFLLTATAGGSGGTLRALRWMAALNLTVAVVGNTVLLIDQNGLITAQSGHLATSVGPVQIVDNPTQFFLVDGTYGYYGQNGVLTRNTVLVRPTICAEQDGFALVNQAGTDQFFQSNLNDFSIWDELNYSSADSEPSAIQSIVSIFRQLWIFKVNSTEIWNNVGANGFVFARMQGAFIETGCAAPYSACKVGDHLCWLGQNVQGSYSVYTNDGYSAVPISTHAIDYQIERYIGLSQAGVTDAFGFSYKQAGHLFYVLIFPSGNATWVYDFKTQLWHERGEYLNGSYNRWDPACYAFVRGRHWVGSSTSNRISTLDLSYATDDLALTPPSNPKRWLRRWRANRQPVHMPQRFGSLKLDLQTGILVDA